MSERVQDLYEDSEFEKLLEDARRVGKKVAGRLLDGVLHDGYPNGSKA